MPMKTLIETAQCRPLAAGAAQREASREGFEGHSGGAAPLGIRELLVPTDFSAHADVALKYAVRFAALSGAGLTLLHVLEPPMVSAECNIAGPSAEWLEHLSRSARAHLARLCEAEHLPCPPLRQALVRVGRPAELIEETAAQEHIDLIILGTHGRTGLAHLLLGSVAERVLRRAPCPVLVLRAPEATERPAWVAAGATRS